MGNNQICYLYCMQNHKLMMMTLQLTLNICLKLSLNFKKTRLVI